MNTGGKIVNVQLDFDFREGIFSATQGYQLCRRETKEHGESGFDLASETAAKAGHRGPGAEVPISCWVQDYLVENMKTMKLRVE
jgi:hypothetical protein